MDSSHIQHYIFSLKDCLNRREAMLLHKDVELVEGHNLMVATILRKQDSGFLVNFYLFPWSNSIRVPQMRAPSQEAYYLHQISFQEGAPSVSLCGCSPGRKACWNFLSNLRERLLESAWLIIFFFVCMSKQTYQLDHSVGHLVTWLGLQPTVGALQK